MVGINRAASYSTNKRQTVYACFWLPSLGVCYKFFRRKIRVGGCINAPICTPSPTAIIVFFRPKLIGWPKQCLLNGPPLWGLFLGCTHHNKTTEKHSTKAYLGQKHVYNYGQLFVGAVSCSFYSLLPNIDIVYIIYKSLASRKYNL